MNHDPSTLSAQVVDETIAKFAKLDQSADKRIMNKMARRLGKEQPALLQFAAQQQETISTAAGEAAVFYSTLVWAMFDHRSAQQKVKCPRLTAENLSQAQTILQEERQLEADLSERPIHEQIAPPTEKKQPHIYAKLKELISGDVSDHAMSKEIATAIYPLAQVVVEAFDAAITGRRPGEHVGPVVRKEPKIGRNEPCSCGSGKKYKKCHGAAALSSAPT